MTAPDHAERLRAIVRSVDDNGWRDTGYPDETDIDAVLDELKQLRERAAELEAVLAEGNQRDRALALLLLRSGGQVEFTQVEQATAPEHGHLISFPNLVTGGLVLAYSADGVTIGVATAAPQQPVLRRPPCRDCGCPRVSLAHATRCAPQQPEHDGGN